MTVAVVVVLVIRLSVTSFQPLKSLLMLLMNRKMTRRKMRHLAAKLVVGPHKASW
jgi:hypothetical protein